MKKLIVSDILTKLLTVLKSFKTKSLVKSSSMDQLLGETKQFAYNFPPRGWTFCHGQLLQITQNTALFALLGTSFGGDGIKTFALPDYRPRDKDGNVIKLYVGENYNGAPYLETSICYAGDFPQRD